MAVGAAPQDLVDHEAGLDGLAEPDFVGDQDACGEPADDRERWLELKGQKGKASTRTGTKRLWRWCRICQRGANTTPPRTGPNDA